MIVKLLKQVYKSPDDFAVRTPINELICKIAKFSGGYYLYNKLGDQIAQIIFEDNAAYLSVSGTVPVFPGSIKMVYNAGQFYFPAITLDRNDEQFLANIKNKKAPDNFSLRGDITGYSYDLYIDNVVYANVVPSSTEKDYYLVRINKDYNIFKGLLVVLAIDYFINQPIKK